MMNFTNQKFTDHTFLLFICHLYEFGTLFLSMDPLLEFSNLHQNLFILDSIQNDTRLFDQWLQAWLDMKKPTILRLIYVKLLNLGV
jgi:hypothetical protein